MLNIQINELINNNWVLYYFLDSNNSFKSKLLKNILFFITIPITLLVLSFYHNILITDNDDSIGMLEDSLFLFAVFLIPIQLLILNLIINKFIIFLEEIPSFTKKIGDKDLLSIISKYKIYIGRKRSPLIVLKIVILGLFLLSNISSIYNRENAWNSPDNPLEFYITVLYLIIIFSVLIEILFKLLIIIIAQIKLTTELNYKNLLEIKPLSLDKSGSLVSLSEVSLSFTYILVPFMISALAHYMTWSILTNGFIAEIILIGLLTIFLFLFPLGTVHSLMKNSKKELLREIDSIYILTCDKLLGELKNGKEDISNTKEKCETIKQLYEKGKKMPVWPFDLRILIKFSSVFIGPIILVLIEIVVRNVIEIYF